MSDVNASINIDINSANAVSGLRQLQAQISRFNESVIASNAAAAAAQKQLNAQLLSQVGAIKGFTSSITTVESQISRLGKSIDKNKLSLGEYFRYGAAASRTFGRFFAREHNEVIALAEDRVKRLQTQYVGLGEAQNGMTRALATRPLQLFNADAAISIQRQQLLNKLMHDGSTSLVNWGKNTQWAGRQLMVGFTIPVTMFGTVAAKVFMDLEKQIINFKRVYGDLGTTIEESDAMAKQVQDLGKEYTKYGIAVADTIGLAAKAAAAGAQGADLLAATEQATRLATLGQIDQNQALTATIALQSAFNIGAAELGSTIDFLNAVENQTVVSLDDITVAIPKVATVIKGLGGDVQDLSVFLAAMREGGINAAEGANALKSGLASMINPTKNASEMLKRAGINMEDLIKKNKGDLMGLVQDFGAELQNLDKFSRQQVLAKVFGKYQFARMGALFENINKEGSQAQRVLQLSGESMQDLAALSEKELGRIEQAVGVKFMSAVEKLKLAIAPIGEMFLKIATPVVEILTKIVEKFNALPEGAKNFIIIGTAISAVLVPSVIMLVGLLGNFLGNMMKIGIAFRSFIGRIRGGGEAFNYYESQELDAMAAAASLEGKVNSLTGEINVQRSAVLKLASAYETMALAARTTVANLPQGFRPMMGGIRTTRIRAMATGGVVPGTGNKDTVPALLTPGESVINKEASQKYAPILAAMNAGTLKGYAEGDVQVNVPGSWEAAHFGGQGQMTGQELLDWSKGQSQAIQERLTQLVNSVENGLDRVFITLDNRVTALSREVNQAVGETGSGRTVATSLARRDLVDYGSIAHPELVRQLKAAKVPIEQIQGIVEQITTEITVGFNDLGDQALVTAEDIDRITKEAYARVAETDARVDAAYKKMQAPTTVIDPTARSGQQERIPVGGSYKTKRTTYNRQMQEVATTAIPYEQKGAIRINADIASRLGASRQEIANAFKTLDDSVKIRLASLVGNAEDFATVMSAELRAAGMTLAEAALQGERDGFRVSSPSRAANEIGQEVPRGTAEGIEETTPQATAAARVMAQEVLAVAENTLDQLSLEQLRTSLSNVPQEGQAARMTRIGSYGGDPRMIVNQVSQGNAAMEAEVARLRALQVEERAILSRVIEMENAELAQRKVALQAAIIRKEQAEKAATTGMAQATVQATTPGVRTIPITGQGAGGTVGLGGKQTPVNGEIVEPISEKTTKDTESRAGRIRNSFASITPKIAGVSIAASMAAGAFAGMEGPVGEFAQKIFPLLGILDLVTIPLTLIGPAGVGAGAGLEAAGAGGAAGATGIRAFFASMAAAAGPITLIVVALAALGAAFKITYDRFEPLRVAVDGLIETVKNLAGMIFGELVAAFKQLFGITDEGGNAFQSFGDILQKVADFLGPIFTAYIQGITKWITMLANTIRIIIKVFQMFFSVIRMVGGIIMGALSTAITWVLDHLGPVGDKFKEIASAIGEAFKNIPQIVGNAVSSIAKFIEDAVNFGIKAINALGKAYTDNVPDALKFGITFTPIEEFKLAGATEGEAPNQGGAYYGTGDTYAGMTAYDYRTMTAGRRPEEEGEGLLPEDPSGAGERQKSWLEKLIEDTNANYELFVGSMAKNKQGLLEKLKKQIPNMPEQLIEAIGEGPEALKNIRALLTMNGKKRNELIKKMTQTAVAKTVSNAIETARKIKAERSQAGQAEAILLSKGFTPEEAKEIASNSEYAFSIVQASAGNAKQSLDEVINAVTGVVDATKEAASAEEQLGWLNDLMEAQQIQHDQEMRNINDSIKGYQDQIDKINEEIEAIEALNKADQDRISKLERQKELISRQIEQLDRANEMDQRRIEKIKREDEIRNRIADALSYELEQMSKQEEEIKKSYDTRIKALDEIAKINDYIINQQKSQIGLAQALSQGDVYAAAQAQAEMQGQQMQFAREQQRTALQQGMENQIGALTTTGGLTREQAEVQIASIKEQSYQTSLQIRDIEDVIYQRNLQIVPLKDQQYQLDLQIRDIQDVIYSRESDIKKIQDERIAPLQAAMQAQQKIKEQKEDEFAAQVESQKALIDQAKLTDLQGKKVFDLAKSWNEVAKQILAANQAMQGSLAQISSPKWSPDYPGGLEQFAKDQQAYEEKVKDIKAKRDKAANDAMAAGKAASAKMSAGGSVFGMGGRDSIGAMLTPGEFVIRKASVDKYGTAMLSQINQGSFSTPKYSIAKTKQADISNVSARSEIIAPVYNTYSINVPVTQPNASADDIANKVLTKIRNIENSSIRRISGY